MHWQRCQFGGVGYSRNPRQFLAHFLNTCNYDLSHTCCSVLKTETTDFIESLIQVRCTVDVHAEK